MLTAISKDGTPIAFSRTGSGPALIVVDGALCYRASGPSGPLATARGRWACATSPTLVMDGGKSPAWMRNAMRSLAEVLPHATYRTLPGQTHMINAKAHVPALVEFFAY